MHTASWLFFKLNNSPIIFYAKMGYIKYYIETGEATQHLGALTSLPEDPCGLAHATCDPGSRDMTPSLASERGLACIHIHK